MSKDRRQEGDKRVDEIEPRSRYTKKERLQREIESRDPLTQRTTDPLTYHDPGIEDFSRSLIM